MLSTIRVVAAAFLVCAGRAASAQNGSYDGLDTHLGNLYRLSTARTLSISPENPTGEGDLVVGDFHPRGVQAFFDRFPDGQFENLKVQVAGDIGTFEWDFVATDANGQRVRVAGCDLLEFAGDKVAKKNAFRKVRA